VENPYRIVFYDLQKNREELQTIIDSSPIMIFYKDRENKFIRVNKVLAEATGLPKGAIEGKTVFEIYPNQTKKYWEDDKEVIDTGKPKIGIIEPMDTATGTRWVQTDKIPYRDKEGSIIGIIGFAMDITERKLAENALEEEHRRLQQALDEVKTLRGIVPICANCKKIRDDKGFWNQVEKYVSDHTEAKFSHGICPDCAKELYPDLSNK
jgi:PAS domain S-box-containing protein